MFSIQAASPLAAADGEHSAGLHGDAKSEQLDSVSVTFLAGSQNPKR